MKQDKVVSKTIDKLCSEPYRFRLKHPKEYTPKQKRAIRRAFNVMQPEVAREVARAISSLVCFSQCQIVIE